MAKIVVVANQKGGVGKSTTVVNAATGIAMAGKKVLVVDLDPQANTSSGLGIEKGKAEMTVYDILLDPECDLAPALLPSLVDGLKVLPSNDDLSGAQVELNKTEDKYFILKKRLKAVKHDFDFIIIDTPPSLGFLTISALAAGDEVLVPLQTEYYALEGVSQLFKTIDLVKQKLNPSLKVLGIVLTMFDVRTNLSTQVMEEVQKAFGDKVFKTIIPRNIKLSEAPSFGKPVQLYQPSSVGAQSYMELSKEIINHG